MGSVAVHLGLIAPRLHVRLLHLEKVDEGYTATFYSTFTTLCLSNYYSFKGLNHNNNNKKQWLPVRIVAVGSGAKELLLFLFCPHHHHEACGILTPLHTDRNLGQGSGSIESQPLTTREFPKLLIFHWKGCRKF